MKKTVFSFFFILILAVSISGCLSNDTNYGMGDDTIPESTSDPSEPVQILIPVFDANLTLVDPIPSDFSFLSTATVRSHGQHIGVTDAIFGYQGIYKYGENQTPVFLTYYSVGIANTTKTSDSYIQMMKDSHAQQYGANSSIKTIQINGHDAVLFAAETKDAPQYGRYMLAWTLGDDMFATVTGNVDSSVLIELATATGY